MSCGCKKNVNDKYLTDEEKLENGAQKINGLKKIGGVFAQLFFGLFVGLIIFICLVPFCLYITVNMCLGKRAVIRIPNFTKWFKK